MSRLDLVVGLNGAGKSTYIRAARSPSTGSAGAEQGGRDVPAATVRERARLEESPLQAHQIRLAMDFAARHPQEVRDRIERNRLAIERAEEQSRQRRDLLMSDGPDPQE